MNDLQSEDIGSSLFFFLLSFVLGLVVVYFVVDHYMDTRKARHMATIDARKAVARRRTANNRRIPVTPAAEVVYISASNKYVCVHATGLLVLSSEPKPFRYTRHHHLVLPDGRFVGVNEQNYLCAVSEADKSVVVHAKDGGLALYIHKSDYYVFRGADGFLGLWPTKTPDSAKFKFNINKSGV